MRKTHASAPPERQQSPQERDQLDGLYECTTMEDRNMRGIGLTGQEINGSTLIAGLLAMKLRFVTEP